MYLHKNIEVVLKGLDINLYIDHYIASLKEGFPSGQRDQTVNLTRELRRFESFSLHHILSKCSAGIV